MDILTKVAAVRVHRRNRVRLLWRLSFALLFMLGNAWGDIAHADTAPAQANPGALVWPKPPAPARIRYLRSVVTPADWGITSGLLTRFLDAVTGTAPLRFVRPTGIAERGGVLFVADPGAQSLFIFDLEQGQARQVNKAGEDPMASPVAVSPGPADTVFVADSVLRRVFVFDRAGMLVHTIVWSEFSRPAAVAFDAAADRLYVADSAAHRIAVFTGTGQFLRAFGERGAGDGQFNSPTHLALSRDGQLFVTDALNFRVQAFDGDGRFLWKLGRLGDGSGDFASPKGLALDSEHQLYVVDALFDAVQIFRRDGTLLLGFGGRGSRAGQFWLPGGLFIGAGEFIYVADAYNRRIQVFQRLPATESEGGR